MVVDLYVQFDIEVSRFSSLWIRLKNHLMRVLIFCHSIIEFFLELNLFHNDILVSRGNRDVGVEILLF